jgi:hypothetical protein
LLGHILRRQHMTAACTASFAPDRSSLRAVAGTMHLAMSRCQLPSAARVGVTRRPARAPPLPCLSLHAIRTPAHVRSRVPRAQRARCVQQFEAAAHAKRTTQPSRKVTASVAASVPAREFARQPLASVSAVSWVPNKQQPAHCASEPPHSGDGLVGAQAQHVAHSPHPMMDSL